MNSLYWIEELETMNLEKLNRYHFNKLRDHLEYVYNYSIFYKRRFDEANIRIQQIKDWDDFRKIPFVSKGEIIQDQELNPPFGSMLARPKDEISRIFWAPGPELVYFTREDWEDAADRLATILYTSGFRSTDLVNITTTFHWVIAGAIHDASLGKIGSVIIPGGVGMSKTHIEMMKKTRATVLFAFWTFAEELANKAGEMGVDPARDLNLRLLHGSGEMRSADLRNRLEEIYGVETREEYGFSETPHVAAECAYGVGMHIEPRTIVEIINPDTGQLVEPGQPGEVVTTDFTKKAMPTIRYRSGDITAGLNMEPCPCGRTTPQLLPIIGRVSDIPRVKGLFVVPNEVESVIKKFPELGKFQLVVDRPGTQDELKIRVGTSYEMSESRMTELSNLLVNEFKNKIRITTKVELVAEHEFPDQFPVVVDNRSFSA